MVALAQCRGLISHCLQQPSGPWGWRPEHTAPSHRCEPPGAAALHAGGISREATADKERKGEEREEETHSHEESIQNAVNWWWQEREKMNW